MRGLEEKRNNSIFSGNSMLSEESNAIKSKYNLSSKTVKIPKNYRQEKKLADRINSRSNLVYSTTNFILNNKKA